MNSAFKRFFIVSSIKIRVLSLFTENMNIKYLKKKMIVIACSKTNMKVHHLVEAGAASARSGINHFGKDVRE